MESISKDDNNYGNCNEQTVNCNSITITADVHNSDEQQELPTGETTDVNNTAEVNNKDTIQSMVPKNDITCTVDMEKQNGEAIPVIIITGQEGTVPDAEYVVDQDGVLYTEVNLTKLQESVSNGSKAKTGDVLKQNQSKGDILKENENSDKLVTYKIFCPEDSPTNGSVGQCEISGLNEPIYTAHALSPTSPQSNEYNTHYQYDEVPSCSKAADGDVVINTEALEWTLVEECLSKTAIVKLTPINIDEHLKNYKDQNKNTKLCKKSKSVKETRNKNKKQNIIMGPEQCEYTIVRGKKKKKNVSVRLLQEIDKKRAERFGKFPKSYAEWKKIEKFEKTGIDYKKGQGRRGIIGEFPCNQCDYIATQKSHLQAHRAVHVKKWIKCKYCKFETRSDSKMMEHEARHTGDKPFKCDFNGCDYAGVCKGDLMKHQRKHQTDKPFKCDFCDFTTKWPRNIRHHLLTHTEERPYKCKECGYAFKRQSDLNYHMYRHSDDKPIKCDQCDFRCKTNFEIKCHKLKHSDVRKFQCSYPGCTQRTKTKSDLTKHMKIHCKTLDFVCDLCGKGFKTKDRLKKHQLRHSEDRPWKCDLCDRRFKVKPALRKHINLHAGYKPHSCEICGMRFDGLGNKRKHMVVHSTKDRPLKCPICAYFGKTQDHILAHIGTMHGDKYAYFCEICKKPFKRYHLLQVHYPRCHTEEELAMLENTLQLNIQAIKSEAIDEITRSELEKRNAELNWDCIIVKDERVDENECSTNLLNGGTVDESVRQSEFTDSSHNGVKTSHSEVNNASPNIDVKPDVKSEVNILEPPKPATLAIYDDFRLPLATVGFQFNFVKKGKKTKAWWMDTSLMDETARMRHQRYLKRKQDEVLFGYYNSKRRRRTQGSSGALKEKKRQLFAAGKYWSNKGVINKVIPYKTNSSKRMPNIAMKPSSGSESSKLEAEKLLDRSIKKSRPLKKKTLKRTVYCNDYKKPKIPVPSSKLKLNLKMEGETNKVNKDSDVPSKIKAHSPCEHPKKEIRTARKRKTEDNRSKHKISRRSNKKSSANNTKATKVNNENKEDQNVVYDDMQTKKKLGRKQDSTASSNNAKKVYSKIGRKPPKGGSKVNESAKQNSDVKSKLGPKPKHESQPERKMKTSKEKTTKNKTKTMKVKITKKQKKSGTKPPKMDVILSVDHIKQEPSDDYEQMTADIDNIIQELKNTENQKQLSENSTKSISGQLSSRKTLSCTSVISDKTNTKKRKAAELPDYLQPKIQKTNKRRGQPYNFGDTLTTEVTRESKRQKSSSDEEYLHPKYFRNVPLEKLAVDTTSGMLVLYESSKQHLIPLHTLTSRLKGTSLSKDSDTVMAKKHLMPVDKFGVGTAISREDLQNKLRQANKNKDLMERPELFQALGQTIGSESHLKQKGDDKNRHSVFDISEEDERLGHASKKLHCSSGSMNPRTFNKIPLDKIAVDTNTGEIVAWDPSMSHLISLQTLSSQALQGTSIGSQSDKIVPTKKQLTPVQNVSSGTLQKVKKMTTERHEPLAAVPLQSPVGDCISGNKPGKRDLLKNKRKRNTKSSKNESGKKTKQKSSVLVESGVDTVVEYGEENEHWSSMPAEIEIDNAIENELDMQEINDDGTPDTGAYPVTLHCNLPDSQTTSVKEEIIGGLASVQKQEFSCHKDTLHQANYSVPFCDDIAVMRASINESIESLSNGPETNVPDASFNAGSVRLRQQSSIAHLGLAIQCTHSISNVTESAVSNNMVPESIMTVESRQSNNVVVNIAQSTESLQTSQDVEVSPVKIEPSLT